MAPDYNLLRWILNNATAAEKQSQTKAKLVKATLVLITDNDGKE